MSEPVYYGQLQRRIAEERNDYIDSCRKDGKENNMKLMAEQTTEEIRQKHIRLDGTCVQKAKARGQMTFTIVEQDITASETVAEWIKLNCLTAPPAKLYEALEFVIAAREFSNKKHAD